FPIVFPAQAYANLPLHTIELRLENSFACGLDPLTSFIQQAKAKVRLALARISRGELTEVNGTATSFRAAFNRRQSALHELQSQLGIAIFCEQGSAKETRSSLKTCEPAIDENGYRFVGIG